MSDMRLSGTNLERAADHNLRVALHAIRVAGAMTRPELAAIIGLTLPAVANIVKRLLSDGLILDAGRRLGGRGQPPSNLVVNPRACFAIGVNVDRDHITMVIVDFVGRVIGRVSREQAYALPDDVRAFYRAGLDRLIEEAGVDPERIIGIGVARPDDLGGVALPGRPATYAQWDDIDFADLLGEPLRRPVFTENDATAAAMGELQLGHGQHRSSFFYILISAGLGGGVVVDGNYFRGATGRSGEIGFFLVPGTTEDRPQIQHSVSLSGLAHRLETAGLDVTRMLRSDDADAAVERVVDAWIAEAAALLCDPLIAVNCLINPDAVLIGGRLPARFVDRLARRLEAELAQRGRNVPALAPVMRAMLAQDAPAVGAAILPLSHFLLPEPNALWKRASATPAVPISTARAAMS